MKILLQGAAQACAIDRYSVWRKIGETSLHPYPVSSDSQSKTSELLKVTLFVTRGPLKEALLSSILMAHVANEASDSEQVAVEDVNEDCFFSKPHLE